MGKRLRRSYGAPPPEPYDGIILRSQKREGALVLTVFTRQAGLQHVYVSRTGKALKSGMGNLQAFGEISFDAWQQGGALRLSEYESKGGALLRDVTLEQFSYAAVFVEMVLYLFPEPVADMGAYTLIRRYGRFLPIKDSRIVTVLAGWQLVRQAGLCPDIGTVSLYKGHHAVTGEVQYYLSDEAVPEGMKPVLLSEDTRRLWGRLLDYAWQADETLLVNRQGINQLEQVLYAYIWQCTDRPLKTIHNLLTNI